MSTHARGCENQKPPPVVVASPGGATGGGGPASLWFSTCGVCWVFALAAIAEVGGKRSKKPHFSKTPPKMAEVFCIPPFHPFGGLEWLEKEHGGTTSPVKKTHRKGPKSRFDTSGNISTAHTPPPRVECPVECVEWAVPDVGVISFSPKPEKHPSQLPRGIGGGATPRGRVVCVTLRAIGDKNT